MKTFLGPTFPDGYNQIFPSPWQNTFWGDVDKVIPMQYKWLIHAAIQSERFCVQIASQKNRFVNLWQRFVLLITSSTLSNSALPEFFITSQFCWIPSVFTHFFLRCTDCSYLMYIELLRLFILWVQRFGIICSQLWSHNHLANKIKSVSTSYMKLILNHPNDSDYGGVNVSKKCKNMCAQYAARQNIHFVQQLLLVVVKRYCFWSVFFWQTNAEEIDESRLQYHQSHNE